MSRRVRRAPMPAIKKSIIRGSCCGIPWNREVVERASRPGRIVASTN